MKKRVKVTMTAYYEIDEDKFEANYDLTDGTFEEAIAIDRDAEGIAGILTAFVTEVFRLDDASTVLEFVE